MVFTPHYHGTGHSPLRKALHVPYRYVGTWLASVSSAVICVSESERALYLSHFPKTESKVSVIPNGADLEPILEAEPMTTDKRIVLSAGRIESYKHVERTIDAMGQLGDEYDLIVTGDGPDRPGLEGRTKELGLEHRVRFLGRVEVDELYRWFRTAEVYVSMSTNEAMPVTVCETLACGARVVLSDIPAHRDLQARFGDAITVVPDGASASDLASSIEKAASSGAQLAAAVPTWTDVAAATRAVYEAVIDRG
jgi:glycosyltransferase involved in cell wall biosynthesis